MSIKILCGRHFSIFCTFVLSLYLGTSAVLAGATLDRIKSERKITVGIFNQSPWGFKTEAGEVSGFSPDLVREAFAPLGISKIDFVISEFGALIPGLTAQRFDAIAAGLYITPARCQNVAFSDPDLSLKDAILVKKGNPLGIHSYADMLRNEKIRFGVSRGSANAKNAADAGVPDARTSLFQDTDSTVGALVADRVDAISFSAPTAIALTQNGKLASVIERALPFKGFVQPNGIERSGYSAIAFRLEDKDLRDAYNKRLAEMKADGTMVRIMKKYGFTDAEAAPNLTQEQICAGNG